MTEQQKEAEKIKQSIADFLYGFCGEEIYPYLDVILTLDRFVQTQGPAVPFVSKKWYESQLRQPELEDTNNKQQVLAYNTQDKHMETVYYKSVAIDPEVYEWWTHAPNYLKEMLDGV